MASLKTVLPISHHLVAPTAANELGLGTKMLGVIEILLNPPAIENVPKCLPFCLLCHFRSYLLSPTVILKGGWGTAAVCSFPLEGSGR